MSDVTTKSATLFNNEQRLDRAIDLHQVVLIELELLKDKLRKTSDKRDIERLEMLVMKSSSLLSRVLNE
jgi:hypothetical protein